jgi:hypothetical protein
MRISASGTGTGTRPLKESFLDGLCPVGERILYILAFLPAQ